MKVSNRNNEIIEWGKEPEDGMILVGFSCGAVLEGTDLKQEIISLVKEKEVGYRKAVSLFKEKGLPTFEEAKRVVDEIKEDLAKSRSPQQILAKKYNYIINRVFWTYEENIPIKDPRYFKLDVIDCKDMTKYTSEDKSFNASKFIRENLSEKDLKRINSQKNQGLIYNEIAPKDETNVIDEEWIVKHS